MPRINPIDPAQAQGNAKQLLDGVQQTFGMAPNIMKTMAHSPASLGAYLAFSQAMSGASLPADMREQISLAIAGINNCEYCASAHTAIGGTLGLDVNELTANINGMSRDAKVGAAMKFARAVIDTRGGVEDADLQAVREAGFGDAEIVEIIALVAINIFTNYFNHAAQTELDFPRVELGASAVG